MPYSPPIEATPAGFSPPAPPRGTEGLDYTVSPRVRRGASARTHERQHGEPVFRPLRIFTLNASASRLDGAIALVNVPYEPLEPGPVGRLFEVVDDGFTGEPPSPALDLDHPFVLMSQGVSPSVSDPRFRAQMAYAVCSTTYAAFRQALGRDIAWGFAPPSDRLRVRCCVADGDRNAFYDPRRGEIRLGAFIADDVVRGRNVPRGLVCTALQHDVVAHEMSHALLDGLRARFLHASNPDVLAFHEAFADLVALFQRFTYRDVVRAAVRATRGDVGCSGLLTRIGEQFAETAGLGDALRNAVGGTKRSYADVTLPAHERGEILLSAVFQAFRTVYRRKTSRYLRLATDGTGELPPGEISDLLADVLTEQASKLASQFLGICIRAIDYCPPIDLTFGEYLRAVITADADLVPDDPWGYREAWIDAFRAHGIYPPGVKALTEDALLWQPPDVPVPPASALSFAELEFAGDPAHPASAEELERQARALGELVADPRYLAAFGLAGAEHPALEGDAVDLPLIESIRSSRRIGPNGQVVFDLVAEVIQRRRARLADDAVGPLVDFYGGATIILDPLGQVRYVIRKSVLHPERLQGQRDYVTGPGAALFGEVDGEIVPVAAPFRMLHSEGRGGA